MSVFSMVAMWNCLSFLVYSQFIKQATDNLVNATITEVGRKYGLKDKYCKSCVT